jgi:hypothetical protein
VVTPARILCSPDSRNVIMPSSIAFFLNSSDEAPIKIKFTNVVVDFHHFVKTDSSLVTGVVAGRAAFTFEGLERLGFFGLKPTSISASGGVGCSVCSLCKRGESVAAPE